MAKRKTPKSQKPEATQQSGTVELTIDGANVTVPVLVERLLKDQREAIMYYEHVLSLWDYKVYQPNEKEILKNKNDYSNELHKFILELVPTYKERIEDFKKHEEQLKKNEKEVATNDNN